MNPISINLAGRPFYNRTLYLAAYGVSLTVLVTMTVLNVVMFTADQVALSRIADAQTAMGAELDGLDRREAAIRRGLQSVSLGALAGEVKFTREALLQRYFSWTLLFNRLEALLPHDVKLQSIRPSIREDHIQIGVAGVAGSPEAFTRFEEALLGSPLFADVYPDAEVWEGERLGLTFTLSFRYLPDRGADPAAPVAGAAGEAPLAVGLDSADLAAGAEG